MIPTNINTEFTTKQGCRLRDLEFQLIDVETSEPLDITNCTVYFRMRKANASLDHVRELCIVNAAATGEITYQWSADAVGTAGLFVSDFQVVYPDGRILPVPDSYYFKVRVLP